MSKNIVDTEATNYVTEWRMLDKQDYTQLQDLFSL